MVIGDPWSRGRRIVAKRLVVLERGLPSGGSFEYREFHLTKVWMELYILCVMRVIRRFECTK